MKKEFKDVFKKNFSLDSRSLALFRVGLGVSFLMDYLFTRIPYADLFYFQSGLNWSNSHFSSLAFIHSANWFQLLLLLCAVVCFFFFTIGYHTKYAAFFAWLITVSFHAKNPIIVNAGDILGYLLLFWSLPLPLSKHFSFDSALKKQKPSQYFSLFSIFFIGQIVLVYFFTFFLKHHPIWRHGDAVYYALMLDNFRTTWGDILLQYPLIMKISTFITYYVIEGSVCLLLLFLGFIPRLRTGLICLMVAFHISLNIAMHLGMFSYFCIFMWLALLPSEFWDNLKKYIPQKPLDVYFDDSCSFCKKSTYLLKTFLILPYINVKEAQSNPSAFSKMQEKNSWLTWDADKGWQSRFSAFAELISRSPLLFYVAPLLRKKTVSFLGDKVYRVISQNRKNLNCFFIPEDKPLFQNRIMIFILSFFYLFCFLYVIAWNIRTLNFNYYKKYFPRKYNEVAYFLHISQYWSMFAPYPTKTGGYVILLATRKDGTKVDLWRNGEPVSITAEAPHRYDESFPVFRFRKMMESLISKKKYKKAAKNYLRYLCHKWNKKPAKNSITSIEFIYMSIKTPEPGQLKAPATKKSIVHVGCSPP